MKETEKRRQVVIEIGPSNSPYAKIILPECHLRLGMDPPAAGKRTHQSGK
jgi:hypothetical protein